MSRISLDVTDEQHVKIKIMASLQNKTIKEFIIDNIFNMCEKEFNRATIKAIEEMRCEENLNIYNTAEELFARFNK